MSTKLPTLDDMLDPDKKVEPAANETKQEKNIRRRYKDKKEEIKEEKKSKEEIKKEEIKEEPKKEEVKKEEDIIEEIKIEEIKKEEVKEEIKEEPKNEEVKKEEIKKEEQPKEEKKEEIKIEEKQKEENPKVDEEKKEEAKKKPKKPREPEPKIPTDFTEFINEINDLKKAGNESFKNGAYEEAISKYKEAFEKLEKELPKIDKERDYNPQSIDLLKLYIQIAQNLSLCYFKTEKYTESIELDRRIISRDDKYDKAYYRLFKSLLKLDKKDEALYFGKILLAFDEDTKKRYEQVIPEIEETEKELKAKYDAIRAKERKEWLKSMAKYAIPAIVLIVALLIYWFGFKRKRLAK